MTIFEAYTLASGNYVAEFSYGSPKMSCPFTGLYHNDPRSLRIYPNTNSAYCFACREYYTPVKLVALSKELSEEEAVEWILSEKGYVEPDFESVWDDITTEAAVSLDSSYLAEALKVACSRMDPDWDTKQFNEAVSKKLTQCLSVLPLVHTEADIEVWLSTSKKAMSTVLARN